MYNNSNMLAKVSRSLSRLKRKIEIEKLEFSYATYATVTNMLAKVSRLRG